MPDVKIPDTLFGRDAPEELRGLAAPAKLNLFLHVTGRRDDGYHQLETVFEMIDLADTIDLRCRADGQIRLLTPIPGVAAETDLTVRAARLLAQASGSRLGVDIGVVKRIPMGAGLGGGSSDAATVLLGLNRLWGLAWPRQRLAELGLKLGADVPFFIGGHTAFATGVGEQLLPISLPQRHYVLLTPAVHVATAAVFQAPELTRNSKPLKLDSLSQLRQVFQAIEFGKNDLQSVVVRRFPLVAEALEALSWSARDAGLAVGSARMSGSGSSVFLPVNDGETALKVVRHLQDRISQGVPPGDRSKARPYQLAGSCWSVRSLREHPI